MLDLCIREAIYAFFRPDPGSSVFEDEYNRIQSSNSNPTRLRNGPYCQCVTHEISMGGKLYQTTELDGMSMPSIKTITRPPQYLSACYVILRDDTNMVFI